MRLPLGEHICFRKSDVKNKQKLFIKVKDLFVNAKSINYQATKEPANIVARLPK